MNERDEKSQTHEKELRMKIEGLRTAEEEIRKLRQKKESKLRNIVFKREAEKIRQPCQG